MAFLDDLEKTIVKVGEATVQKTKEVAEFAKINAKILDVQNKLDKAYIRLGKKYVEIHPVADVEEMKGVLDPVCSLEEQLKELRRQLQELKGTVTCEKCGNECSMEATFCSLCGTELKNEKVIFDAEEVVVDAEDIEDTVE